jgi:hypothetical protein
MKAEKIKREIDFLSNDMLIEVEKFIKSLKTRRKSTKVKSVLLSELADIATEVDIPEDFSRQHDHYLYGLPKK